MKQNILIHYFIVYCSIFYFFGIVLSVQKYKFYFMCNFFLQIVINSFQIFLNLQIILFPILQ